MQYGENESLEEVCPVCGDKVSGYHYGLLTCESCKGFFKRTVQNNKTYTCVDKQDCIIDKTQRKRCPFCRFQKCLHVGMRLEAVRADRIRGGRNRFGPMYKQDRALKQQRKALIQANGFTIENSPVSSNHHGDLTFSGGHHPITIFHSATLLMSQAPLLCSTKPSSSPGASQNHCTFSNWTMKPEQANNCASLPGSAAGISPGVLHLRPFFPEGSSMPQLVMEFLRCDPDQLQLQNKITAHLLQEQLSWEKPGKPSTFRHMCLMADEMLFSIVEWARNSIFFKRLKVSDQMKLLHSCWSDLLLLDIISRQVLHGKEGSLLLITGQEMELTDMASHACPTLASLVQRGQELVEKFHTLKVDRQEFACIKFFILFNPDVKQLEDRQYIQSVQEKIEGARLEYTLCTSSHHLGRFSHLLLCLTDLRSLSSLAENYLCCKHLSAEMPCNNLLMEMLYAKHKWT